MIRTALLSVSDKSGIVPFAKALHEQGVKLISTGGTAKLLAENNLPVVEVSSLTKFPEMLDGRVKTLHPMVHGGLLARRDFPEHMAALKQHGIDTIDILVINLYPWSSTYIHSMRPLPKKVAHLKMQLRILISVAQPCYVQPLKIIKM